ncbi:hypothetical protein VitviT2T_022004 [Vitis vinifera]|uniref:GDSL esterase/lipase n=1 Tax=Vitis vinifera TaxID=29760 RepID=A0ABY9DA78_VITVI|nr:hypothetical protein VitviT2T_022004 [Vitis vinifera]
MDLLLSLFCSIIFLHFLSVNSRDSPPLAPALYVFGDSLFDSGNNNLLPTLTRANYLPYGVNFPGGVTGRFTNGRTVADFIAEYLGLPYPPPSISIHGTVLTGLNYASGSCGILPETRLKDTRNPCCTTWLNGTLSSIPFLEPYPNRSEYFFWDAFHITEAACSLIAARCITGSSACVPMNIKALVQI